MRRARRRPPPRHPSSSRVRGSRISRPSRTRPSTGGSDARRRAAPARRADSGAGSTAQTGPSSSSSGSAPPPTRAGARMTCASTPAVGEPRAHADRARAELRVARGEHPQHRDLAHRGGRVAVDPQRRLERRQRQLVDPQRAGQRMRAAARRSPRACRPSARPAGRRAACRPRSTRRAQPAATERRTGGSSASSGTPVGQRARPDVVDHRHAEARTAPRSRPPRRTRRCGSWTGGRA